MYGYKIALFVITPHMKPDDRLSFDNAQFGEGGAYEYLATALERLRDAAGDSDDRRSDYLRIDSVERNGWGIVLSVSGGSFGEALEVVDTTTGEQREPIAVEHALLRNGHVILIVPPYGNWGVLISEARGNQHHGVPVTNRLHRAVQHASQLALRVESEVADTVAWSQLLDRSTSSVAEVSFISDKPSSDNTAFAGARGVSKAVLSVKLEAGTRAERAVSRAVKRSARTGTPAGLLSAVGISAYDDEAWPEQKAVVVENGARRTLTVGEFPRFIYRLDTDERLDRDDFLEQVEPAVAATMTELGIDRPATWWPYLK